MFLDISHPVRCYIWAQASQFSGLLARSCWWCRPACLFFFLFFFSLSTPATPAPAPPPLQVLISLTFGTVWVFVAPLCDEGFCFFVFAWRPVTRPLKWKTERIVVLKVTNAFFDVTQSQSTELLCFKCLPYHCHKMNMTVAMVVVWSGLRHKNYSVVFREQEFCWPSIHPDF